MWDAVIRLHPFAVCFFSIRFLSLHFQNVWLFQNNAGLFSNNLWLLLFMVNLCEKISSPILEKVLIYFIHFKTLKRL